MSNKPKILVILGPTASGKSALAVRLAKKFNGEIISADSRQIYRYLNVGTGKITPAEMSGIPHHLLSIFSPRRLVTAADFQKQARHAISAVLRRHHLPIIAGGAGFYIDALLNANPLPKVKPNLRLRASLSKKSAAALFRLLKKLDPARAQTIDAKNKHRLIRALEIIKSTGRPVPPLTPPTGGQTAYPALKIGLRPSPPQLKKLIIARTRSMLRRGLIKEVSDLRLKQKLSWIKIAGFGLIYRETALFLQNQISKLELINLINLHTYQYAKRQLTWWRRQKSCPNSVGDIHWIKNKNEAFRLAKTFLRQL